MSTPPVVSFSRSFLFPSTISLLPLGLRIIHVVNTALSGRFRKDCHSLWSQDPQPGLTYVHRSGAEAGQTPSLLQHLTANVLTVFTCCLPAKTQNPENPAFPSFLPLFPVALQSGCKVLESLNLAGASTTF